MSRTYEQKCWDDLEMWHNQIAAARFTKFQRRETPEPPSMMELCNNRPAPSAQKKKESNQNRAWEDFYILNAANCKLSMAESNIRHVQRKRLLAKVKTELFKKFCHTQLSQTLHREAEDLVVYFVSREEAPREPPKPSTGKRKATDQEGRGKQTRDALNQNKIKLQLKIANAINAKIEKDKTNHWGPRKTVAVKSILEHWLTNNLNAGPTELAGVALGGMFEPNQLKDYMQYADEIIEHLIDIGVLEK